MKLKKEVREGEQLMMNTAYLVTIFALVGKISLLEPLKMKNRRINFVLV
jgi:hypothetical protein